jgi:hypothetical protein
MTSPETLYMKNVVNELRFLLVTRMTCFDIRFGRYRILKSGDSADQVLDRLVYRCMVKFLGHKMCKNCLVLHTCYVGNKLIFPTPTQTHVFDNRSIGYGRLSTTHVQSLTGR